MRLTAALALASTILVSACGGADRDRATVEQASSPRPCTELATLTLPNTDIASADVVAAGKFEAPPPPFPGAGPDTSKLPEFCRVQGAIKPTADSDIRFEVWLPEQGWNGKFMQAGSGGAAGFIGYGSLAAALAGGYAVANTDTGHQGAIGDFAWAADHPEKLTDYAYRAVHEITLAGKAITAARYGKAPARSYWSGCSTGGRQGLKEAQRFPDDYDAIVAGAPASNWSPLMAFSILVQRNMTGPDGLAADKLRTLNRAAIAACDASDGVEDDVISDPARCSFDPATIQCAGDDTASCLTPSEVMAAKRIYAGVTTGTGAVLMPGPGPGSELLWAAYASPGFQIGTSYFRNVVVNDPSWDPTTFEVDVDVARAEAQDAGAADAMDPDLSAFIARGGKLITYHGTADGLIPYGNSVNYYRSVVARLGADRVRDHVALYLVPGMGHCSGGAGAFAVDWIGALEQFDESGVPPIELAASHPAPPGGSEAPDKAFTRPVCRFPQVATYMGEGDEADAANWQCADG